MSTFVGGATRFLVILAIATPAGCTREYVIGPKTYPAITRAAQDRSSTVTLSDGRQVKAEHLAMDPETTTWIDPFSRARKAIQTCEVKELRIVSRLRGMFEGLFFGSLAGGAFGAMVVLSSPEDLGMAEAGVALLPIGAILGSSLGGAAGHTTVFRTEQAPSPVPGPAPPAGIGP